MTENSETLLGLDYGESNIGLAIGRNGYTQPLHIVSGKNEAEALKEISRIVFENKIDKVR